jgi:hypothetical protein
VEKCECSAISFSSVVWGEPAPPLINMVKKTMFINFLKIKELVFGPLIQKTNQRIAELELTNRTKLFNYKSFFLVIRRSFRWNIFLHVQVLAVQSPLLDGALCLKASFPSSLTVSHHFLWSLALG